MNQISNNTTPNVSVKKHFHNPNTVYDPAYHNIQADLWTLLNDNQRDVIGGVFKHLKNHVQIAICNALINWIKSNRKTVPSFSSLGGVIAATLFQYILAIAFDVDLDELNKTLKKC